MLDAVLIEDPDIGSMKAVVLSPTSCNIWGIPVVFDHDCRVLAIPRGTPESAFVPMIEEHERLTGHKPDVVLVYNRP